MSVAPLTPRGGAAFCWAGSPWHCVQVASSAFVDALDDALGCTGRASQAATASAKSETKVTRRDDIRSPMTRQRRREGVSPSSPPTRDVAEKSLLFHRRGGSIVDPGHSLWTWCVRLTPRTRTHTAREDPSQNLAYWRLARDSSDELQKKRTALTATFIERG